MLKKYLCFKFKYYLFKNIKYKKYKKIIKNSKKN